MKRICFIVDSIFSIGGVQRVTAVIAKELAKEYDVTILTFDKPEEKNTELYNLNEADINYQFFHYPPHRPFKKKIFRILSGIYLKLQPKAKWCSNLYAKSSFPSELRNALAAELRNGKYDVIVGVHAPLAARLATLRHQLPGVMLVGWIHNSFEALFGDTSRYIGTNRRRHYVYQFRKLNATVVLCQHDADSYRQYDALMKPTVIYNPLTLQPGSVSEGTSKRFLAIGRISPLHKGFDLLIEAFHLFAQNNKDWKLDIIGEGEEEKLYRSLIHKYRLEERIAIYPFTNHIQEYYSNAQVYVLSSRWEGMPLVLMEAMSHGLPIVSSDLPISLEIMGDFGIYFKNGDIEQLAMKLEEATQIEWQQKKQEALEIAQRFDIANIIGQWKELIEK